MISKKLQDQISFLFKEIFDFDFKRAEVKDLNEDHVKVVKELIENGEFTVKFGIAGKAGSGKTSTINALFGENLKVEDVLEGTTKVEKIDLKLGKGKGDIIVYDFPGAQFSIGRDKKIMSQYEKYIPMCDVILWVIESRDRQLKFDEEYLNSLPKKIKDRVIIGISQVDIIEPMNWNRKKNQPSIEQYKNIQRKKKDLRSRFNITDDRIIEFCAYKKQYKDSNGKEHLKIMYFHLFQLVAKLLEATKKEYAYLLKTSFSELVFEKSIVTEK